MRIAFESRTSADAHAHSAIVAACTTYTRVDESRAGEHGVTLWDCDGEAPLAVGEEMPTGLTPWAWGCVLVRD